jgi:uncharacterized peroxidase-related enzyme
MLNAITTPDVAETAMGFLAAPELTPAAQLLFDEDIAELGYVMNLTRLWAYQPATKAALFDVLRQANSAERLSVRQRVILVSVVASTFGDSYCSLVWGNKLAETIGAQAAAGVLRGTDEGLSDSERVMAGWARQIARNPNATSAAGVQALRDAGFTDAQVFTITVFVAMRLAFATINDALGVRPDAALRDKVAGPVLDAVTVGRPIA